MGKVPFNIQRTLRQCSRCLHNTCAALLGLRSGLVSSGSWWVGTSSKPVLLDKIAVCPPTFKSTSAMLTSVMRDLVVQRPVAWEGDQVEIRERPVSGRVGSSTHVAHVRIPGTQRTWRRFVAYTGGFGESPGRFGPQFLHL